MQLESTLQLQNLMPPKRLFSNSLEQLITSVFLIFALSLPVFSYYILPESALAEFVSGSVDSSSLPMEPGENDESNENSDTEEKSKNEDLKEKYFSENSTIDYLLQLCAPVHGHLFALFSSGYRNIFSPPPEL